MTLSIKFKMNKSFIFLEDAIENVVFICTPRSDGFSVFRCITGQSREPSFASLLLPVFKNIFAPDEFNGTPSPKCIFLSTSIINIIVVSTNGVV